MVFPTDILSIISEYANNLLVKHFYVVKECSSHARLITRPDLIGEFICIDPDTTIDAIYDIKPCVYYRNDLLNEKIQFTRSKYSQLHFIGADSSILSKIFTITTQSRLILNYNYGYSIFDVDKIQTRLSSISKEYIRENLSKSQAYIKKFVNDFYTKILSNII